MSELFIELSDQQQELVAGGRRHFSPSFELINNNDTTFNQTYKAAGATGIAQSGKGGSISGGDIFAVYDHVHTTGKSELSVKF